MSFWLPVNDSTGEFGEVRRTAARLPEQAFPPLPKGWRYMAVPGYFWRAQPGASGGMVPLEPANTVGRAKMLAKRRIEDSVRRAVTMLDIDRELADEAVRLKAELDAGGSPAAEDYPLIKAEAEERGLTRQEAITAVMSWLTAHKTRLAELHRRRIRAEQAIDAATTESEVSDALGAFALV